ncbi:MAG: hypothetical protein H8E45_06360 [Proteobacteria bacterium]|nr:hypothetical protein [Pseudomonadota bacterium]
MKILHAAIGQRAYALRTPLRSAAGATGERKNLLLKLDCEQGLQAVAEAAPLHWQDHGSLDLVRRQLEKLVDWINAERPTVSQRNSLLPETADEILERAGLARAAAETACALDCSLLRLAAQRQGLDVPRLLAAGGAANGGAANGGAANSGDEHVSPVLNIGILLTQADNDGLRGEAEIALDNGYRCFKLKVGSLDLAEDLDRLARLRRAVGPGCEIRIDANRAWTPNQAATALASMADYHPSLVEEPLARPDPDALQKLAAAGVALALDESVRNTTDLNRLAGRPGAVSHLLLKTQRLGGIRPALGLARRARQLALEPIVTDSIEGVEGSLAALEVALASRSNDAVGLGGAALIVDHPLTTRAGVTLAQALTLASKGSPATGSATVTC